jgi:hypothetical protein
MKQPLGTLCLLVVLATGCTETDERPANVLLADSTPQLGEGALLVHNYLPEAGVSYPMRLRIDGADLIIEIDDRWEYAKFLAFGYGLGTALPAGSHVVEILDEHGEQQLASVSADVVNDFFHSSSYISGTHESWGHVPARPPGTDTANLEIQNTLSLPLVVERCVDTTCTVLGTVAPAGYWRDEVLLVSNPDPFAVAFLQVRLEGSARATQISGLGPEHTCDRSLGVYIVNTVAPADGYIAHARSCL